MLAISVFLMLVIAINDELKYQDNTSSSISHL
jgi:hypothetical protein